MKPSTAPTDEIAESVREKYLREIAANPKWRDTTQAGSGFVLPGAKTSGKRVADDAPGH